MNTVLLAGCTINKSLLMATIYIESYIVQHHVREAERTFSASMSKLALFPGFQVKDGQRLRSPERDGEKTLLRWRE